MLSALFTLEEFIGMPSSFEIIYSGWHWSEIPNDINPFPVNFVTTL